MTARVHAQVHTHSAHLDVALDAQMVGGGGADASLVIRRRSAAGDPSPAAVVRRRAPAAGQRKDPLMGRNLSCSSEGAIGGEQRPNGLISGLLFGCDRAATL